MVRAFILIPKLLWRLLIYDVSTCKVEAIERKISIVVRKWLALQLSLPMLHCTARRQSSCRPSSLSQRSTDGKEPLSMMLRKSADPAVQKALPGLKKGRKWKVSSIVDSAQEVFEVKGRHRYTQTKRQGFPQNHVTWSSKASTRERRQMVVQEKW